MEHSVYRIIDANFNRAREAVRMVEEFCRFVLNCGLLTERAKQLRHQLSASLDKLDVGRLIAGRDTLSDVGVGRKVDDQLYRADIYDSFVAACKRLTEALRVLAESIQTLNPVVAETIENLRYTAYTLEKDIVLFSDAQKKFKNVKLYVVITSDLPAGILSLVHRCVAGGADCIQLRAKSADDDKVFAVAAEFVKICKDSSVLSVVNDRVDIAAAAGADGVHLGQNDLPVEQAKKLQLSPMIIGKSTHSRLQFERAIDELVTYVSLGPVFKTGTKPDYEPVGLDYVKLGIAGLEGTGIGHVVIGGITVDNVDEVLKAGAKAVAVCSAITEVSDPAAACKAFKEKITASAGG